MSNNYLTYLVLIAIGFTLGWGINEFRQFRTLAYAQSLILRIGEGITKKKLSQRLANEITLDILITRRYGRLQAVDAILKEYKL